MRDRKFELSAWLSLEIGKSWAEADGDMLKAIDYAGVREMLRWTTLPVDSHSQREERTQIHSSRRRSVIPPWNFPLAILVGMGNCRCHRQRQHNCPLKPSSETPASPSSLPRFWKKVGLPPNVFNYMHRVPAPKWVIFSSCPAF